MLFCGTSRPSQNVPGEVLCVCCVFGMCLVFVWYVMCLVRLCVWYVLRGYVFVVCLVCACYVFGMCFLCVMCLLCASSVAFC